MPHEEIDEDVQNVEGQHPIVYEKDCKFSYELPQNWSSFQPASYVKLKAEIGDLIEIDRTLYAHWALFVGDGKVVHVTGNDENDIPTSTEGVVQMCFLEQVAGHSKVRINNKTFRAKERGLLPKPRDESVNSAICLVGKIVDYNFVTQNDEHYVTLWRYGFGWSDQATVAVSVMKKLKGCDDRGHSMLLNGLNTLLNSPASPTSRNRKASKLRN